MGKAVIIITAFYVFVCKKIYKDSIDDIIGYVHISSLFHNPTSIQEVLSKILIVPETMPAQRLLNLFFKDRKSIAVVVDEFGVTAGIVTTEDIMEEIFRGCLFLILVLRENISKERLKHYLMRG